MNFPIEFWQGWFTVCATVAAVLVVLSLVRGYFVVSLGLVFGMSLAAVLPYLLLEFMWRWLAWALGILLVLYLITQWLGFERQVYKWTNGRPDGER
jgi:hypothetical protein